jgi:hypothetical protein
MTAIPATREADGMIMVQSSSRQKQETLAEKQTKSKSAESSAECFPSSHEVLNTAK